MPLHLNFEHRITPLLAANGVRTYLFECLDDEVEVRDGVTVAHTLSGEEVELDHTTLAALAEDVTKTIDVELPARWRASRDLAMHVVDVEVYGYRGMFGAYLDVRSVGALAGRTILEAGEALFLDDTEEEDGEARPSQVVEPV